MKKLLVIAIVAALFVPCAFGQTAGTQTSKVNVTVAAEAGLTVPTDVSLVSVGTLFANYTGSNTFTYYVRTSKSGGSANIQLVVSSDFSPAGGPSVTNSGSSGDTLTYNATVSTPATTAGAQTAALTPGTSVASFGTDAHSAKVGNGGNTVNWTLVNDPMYATGTYSATVTWTISVT